jgi:hypothetical protein
MPGELPSFIAGMKQGESWVQGWKRRLQATWDRDEVICRGRDRQKSAIRINLYPKKCCESADFPA